MNTNLEWIIFRHDGMVWVFDGRLFLVFILGFLSRMFLPKIMPFFRKGTSFDLVFPLRLTSEFQGNKITAKRVYDQATGSVQYLCPCGVSSALDHFPGHVQTAHKSHGRITWEIKSAS
jgi:hypothetical protein